MRGFGAIMRRDITLALRQGGGPGAALGFVLAVLVLVPLSVGPDQVLLQRLAPGVMWLTLLLSVLLTSERIYAPDLEDGSLDGMVLGILPLELTCLAKTLAHWLSVSLPLAIISPCLGILLNLDMTAFPVLLVSMVTGSLALSLLASIGSAVTAGLRRGGLLISILILPLYVPVLIFGVSATAGMAGPSGSAPSLLVLFAIVLISLAVSPWASAAALRIYLR